MLLGFCVGSLVVYASLSSLIATLGMNFMLRGLILIFTEGKSIALPSLGDSLGLQDLLQLRSAGIPVQIFWAIAFVDLLRVSSTTATGSARRCTSSATIPTAPSRWASTSSGCA